MRRNRSGLRHLVFAVSLAEPGAHVAVQLIIERLDLLPEFRRLGLEVSRAHVVVRTPHLTEIGIAQLVRALVGEFDEAGILVSHRYRDLAPAGPVFEQLVVVACAAHELLELRARDAIGFRPAVLAGAINAFEVRRDLGQLLALGCVVRRRRGRAELEQIDGATCACIEVLALVGHGLLHGLAVPLRVALARGRGDDRRVVCDVGRTDPVGGTELATELAQLVVDARDELLGGFGWRRAGGRRSLVPGGLATARAQERDKKDRPVILHTFTSVILIAGPRTTLTREQPISRRASCG